MARTMALVGSLALILLLAALTVTDAVNNGVNALTIVSAGILGLVGFGVIGALTTQPPEE